MAEATQNSCTVRQKFLWAVLEFVALLTAAFTPDSTKGQMIVHHDFQFFGFIGLVKDGLDHGAPLLQIFIRLSCHEDIEWLFVPLLSIVNLGPILGTVSPD